MSHLVPGIRTAGSARIALTKSRFATFAILLNFLSISAFCADVTTSGYMLKVDGKPFVIKGMNYSPVPIGTAPGISPYGDYFVPNYQNVWKPDIDNIRAAGVNVIKLYAGDPKTNAGAPGSSGNWKQFLDYLWNGGKDPVYVIMFSYTQGGVIANGGPGLEGYKTDFTLLVQSTVKHPAVLGYMVGNEIYEAPLLQNPQFWINYGQLVDAAAKAGTDVGKKPFLTTALNDAIVDTVVFPAIKFGEQSGQVKNIDAWCVNIYRGPFFGVPGNSPFAQYAQLMASFGRKKPLIFGEWGTPHTTRPADPPPNDWYGKDCVLPIWDLDQVPESKMGTGQPYFAAVPVGEFLTGQWNTIKDNIAATAQVCVGGFIFDWCDEYWKGNNNFKQQGGPADGFLGGAFAGGYWDEAGFGVTSAVQNSAYGAGKPNINRTLFKGYNAVKTFYSASSHSGGELY